MREFLSILSVVFRRELASYFNVPIAYVYLVVFAVLAGVLTFMNGNFFEIGEASLAYSFFRWHPWLHAFLVPAIGMRVWSRENEQRTLELLMTQPIGLTEVVLGKFLAACAPVLVALALTLPTVATVAWLGEPDYGEIAAGYAGSALMGAAFLGISCLCSAATSSQVVAFIIGSTGSVLLVLLGSSQVSNELLNLFPRTRWMVDSLASVGAMQYFAAFRRGVIEFRSVAYFVVIISFTLLATYRILLKKQDA